MLLFVGVQFFVLFFCVQYIHFYNFRCYIYFTLLCEMAALKIL